MSNTSTIKKPLKKEKLNGHKYTIQSDAERKEVEWLISQGDFISIRQYEDIMTKILSGNKKSGD